MGYHLTSLLFHGANAALFYFVAQRLLRLALPAEEILELRAGAAIAALMFSLQPLRVEAVAGNRQLISQGRQLDPAAGEPYFNLGNLAARQNQIDQAIAYFQQALKLDPNHAPAHNNLGRLLAAHGKLDEAVYHFRQALRVDPKFAAAQESLIAALSQQSKKAEPIRRYP